MGQYIAIGQYAEPTGDNSNTAVIHTQATLFDALEKLPINQTVADNFTIAWSKINSPLYKKILCTISGGSDSDVMLDILTKCDKDKKIEYVFCNTGLEYQATKDHLDELEKRYDVKIQRVRPKWPIPAAVKKYGQPFLNKRPVSEYMQRLQKHGFQWEDKPYEELIQKYPQCQSALGWWCNKHQSDRFNIRNNKLLKEFIIRNPPTFQISPKCCNKSKKSIVHEFMDSGKYDLDVYGVRKAEGGARSTAYHNCFNCSTKGDYDEYRPLYWYKNSDKEDYCTACNIKHSRCYTEYGLKRTGCAGCPFGRDFEEELKVMEKFEPNLFVAANNIFKESYEYTRAYRKFVAEHSKEHAKPDLTAQGGYQMTIFDFLK